MGTPLLGFFGKSKWYHHLFPFICLLYPYYIPIMPQSSLLLLYIYMYIYICIYIYMYIYIYGTPPGTYLSLIYTVNYSIICLFSYVEFDRFFILSFLRHEFRLDFRLECHSLDSCYPRSKIQDFQKAFLGNLGINPRSKIQDFQKTFLGCTCRILLHPFEPALPQAREPRGSCKVLAVVCPSENL